MLLPVLCAAATALYTICIYIYIQPKSAALASLNERTKYKFCDSKCEYCIVVLRVHGVYVLAIAIH